VRRKRLVSRLAGLAVAAALIGGTAPVGIAQDPGYEPAPLPTSPTGGLTKQQLLKKCIAKAKAKFGDNQVKKKAAIKKCKKKYR
jgi:hypothetical protein